MENSDAVWHVGRMMADAMYRKQERGIAKMTKRLSKAERKAARLQRLKLFDELLNKLEDVYYHWPLATYGNSKELRWGWTEEHKEKIRILIDRAREVGYGEFVSPL